MRVTIRRKDGLYLAKNGGFTNKKNASLIELHHAEKVCKRLKQSGIVAKIENENSGY